jgi:hypothetical protein
LSELLEYGRKGKATFRVPRQVVSGNVQSWRNFLPLFFECVFLKIEKKLMKWLGPHFPPFSKMKKKYTKYSTQKLIIIIIMIFIHE